MYCKWLDSPERESTNQGLACRFSHFLFSLSCRNLYFLPIWDGQDKKQASPDKFYRHRNRSTFSPRVKSVGRTAGLHYFYETGETYTQAGPMVFADGLFAVGLIYRFKSDWRKDLERSVFLSNNTIWLGRKLTNEQFVSRTYMIDRYILQSSHHHKSFAHDFTLKNKPNFSN